MEAATKQHFFNHGGDKLCKPGYEQEKLDCHFCQLRGFATHAEYPVTVINNVDDTALDPTFRFTDESVIMEGVERVREEFHWGCTCAEGGGDCQYGGCDCLPDAYNDEDSSNSEEEDEEYADENDGEGQPRTKLYAYHTHGAKAGRLTSKRLDSELAIFECNERCGCGPECPNRVVEQGRKVPLQIFRTKDRGWGVRSMTNIQRGQFVDRYLGEVITPEEADARRAASHIAQRKDVYLFALDKFSDPDSEDHKLRTTMEVDGEFVSGPSRFINHSCEPNLRIFGRVGSQEELHLHDLAFFAIKDIAKGEELTFDYMDTGGRDNEDGDDANDPEKRKDMTRCLCGTPSCRKWLW